MAQSGRMKRHWMEKRKTQRETAMKNLDANLGLVEKDAEGHVIYTRTDFDAAGGSPLPGVEMAYGPLEDEVVMLNQEMDSTSQVPYFPSDDELEFLRKEFGDDYSVPAEDINQPAFDPRSTQDLVDGEPEELREAKIHANLALARLQETRDANKMGTQVSRRLELAALKLEQERVKREELIAEHSRLVEILQDKSGQLTRLTKFYDAEHKRDSKNWRLSADRMPPVSETSERVVMGLLISHPELIGRCSQPYVNLMLYVPTYREIHSSIINLGGRLDRATLVDDLRKRNVLDRVGGEATIERLIQEAEEINPHAFEEHVKILEDKYLLRTFIDECRQIETEIYDFKEENGSVPEFVRKRTTETIQKVLPKRFLMYEDLRADVDGILGDFRDLIARKGKPNISTGYQVMDRITHGFQPGKLHICGADTKMGKTTFMANLADNVAQQGRHVLIFTYESSRSELVKKLIAKYANIDSELFEYFEKVDPSSIEAIVKMAQEVVRELPIMIEDGRTADLDYIKGRTRQVKLQHPDLGLVIVDGMQSFAGYKPYEGTKASIYTEVLKGLREGVSVENKVSTLLTSQLKTAQIYRRPNRRPYRLDDFADCNDIPKVADSAFFIYRPEGYIGQDAGKYFTEENLKRLNLLGKMEVNPVALRIGDRTKKGGWLGANMVTANISNLEEALPQA